MIEQTIISNLLHNEDYTRHVLPYLRSEYFDDPTSRTIFDVFDKYFDKYNSIPSKDALLVALDNRRDLNDESFKETAKFIEGLKSDNKEIQWLVDETERFCQDRDLHHAIRKSIMILDGKEKELDKGAIPKLLETSLSINFDTRVGHDYDQDSDERYEYYTRKESRLPFDLDIFNKITQGGLPEKCLIAFAGGTGTGKSLVMCHMAAAHYMFGKNVLYVTLELAEKEVARRIDANILDINLSNINDTMDKEEFDRKIARVKSKTTGKLVIKEFPTGSMNANHLRHVLSELKSKKDTKIDIVYLDYINLCSSTRVKNTAANSYTIVKSIAEEIRGLAMEFAIPIVTATQLNRSGMNSSDIDISDTSECIFVDENITLRNGDVIKIGDIKPGHQILSNDKFKTVSLVHHKKIKKCYKITLKSGKTIIVSDEHKFPTNIGRKCIADGLVVGLKLNSV